MKEIKIRPKYDDDDYQLKLEAGIRFLKKGEQVKVTVMLRGREVTRPELAEAVLKDFARDLESYAKAEFPIVIERREAISLLFTPKIAG